jgi:colicin import membrane protein
VVVLVRTSPQGKITESRITSTSGNRAFDEAVLRGIQKMEFVPKDVDGRVPEVLLREGLEIKVTL